MLPRSKSILNKSSCSKAISFHSHRNCVSGVNSPYFQIENAPWSSQPEFRDTAQTSPFPVFRCIDWDGNAVDPNFTLPFSEEKLFEMYKNMNLVSQFDEVFYRLARAGFISFYMPNTGEEALQVGSAAVLSDKDMLFFQYRELGCFLQRGFPLQQCADVCFSNDGDYAKGRQMPVHYGSKELNCVTISSTLATQMPQAAGAAYAVKRNGENACVICYFGDGAASEGDAHAGFNLSATCELPMIWFCRNNGYAISTPTIDQYRGDGIAARAYGYGMYAHRFDGNDLFASYISTNIARDLCVSEVRPVMVEAMSYRGSHHSTSDDSKTYRDDSEEELWATRYSPIRRLRCFMEKELLWNDRNEKDLREECENAIDEVYKKGQRTLKPNWRYVSDGVYDVIPIELQKQTQELQEHLMEFGGEEFYKIHEYNNDF